MVNVGLSVRKSLSAGILRRYIRRGGMSVLRLVAFLREGVDRRSKSRLLSEDVLSVLEEKVKS